MRKAKYGLLQYMTLVWMAVVGMMVCAKSIRIQPGCKDCRSINVESMERLNRRGLIPNSMVPDVGYCVSTVGYQNKSPLYEVCFDNCERFQFVDATASADCDIVRCFERVNMMISSRFHMIVISAVMVAISGLYILKLNLDYFRVGTYSDNIQKSVAAREPLRITLRIDTNSSIYVPPSIAVSQSNTVGDMKSLLFSRVDEASSQSRINRGNGLHSDISILCGLRDMVDLAMFPDHLTLAEAILPTIFVQIREKDSPPGAISTSAFCDLRLTEVVDNINTRGYLENAEIDGEQLQANSCSNDHQEPSDIFLTQTAHEFPSISECHQQPTTDADMLKTSRMVFNSELSTLPSDDLLDSVKKHREYFPVRNLTQPSSPWHFEICATMPSPMVSQRRAPLFSVASEARDHTVTVAGLYPAYPGAEKDEHRMIRPDVRFLKKELSPPLMQMTVSQSDFGESHQIMTPMHLNGDMHLQSYLHASNYDYEDIHREDSVWKDVEDSDCLSSTDSACAVNIDISGIIREHYDEHSISYSSFEDFENSVWTDCPATNDSQ